MFSCFPFVGVGRNESLHKDINELVWALVIELPVQNPTYENFVNIWYYNVMAKTNKQSPLEYFQAEGVDNKFREYFIALRNGRKSLLFFNDNKLTHDPDIIQETEEIVSNYISSYNDMLDLLIVWRDDYPKNDIISKQDQEKVKPIIAEGLEALVPIFAFYTVRTKLALDMDIKWFFTEAKRRLQDLGRFLGMDAKILDFETDSLSCSNPYLISMAFSGPSRPNKSGVWPRGLNTKRVEC